MKKYEKESIDNAKHLKNWDAQCIAKDAFLNAVKYIISLAEEECTRISNFDVDGTLFPNELSKNGTAVYLAKQMRSLGSELVDVEFQNGDHQLTDDIDLKTRK